MSKKRDILRDFIDYYAGLSEDARAVIRSLVLVAPATTTPTLRKPRADKGTKRGLPKAIVADGPARDVDD